MNRFSKDHKAAPLRTGKWCSRLLAAMLPHRRRCRGIAASRWNLDVNRENARPAGRALIGNARALWGPLEAGFWSRIRRQCATRALRIQRSGSRKTPVVGYLGIWVLGCFLLCLSGCGKSTPPTYSVSGEVTYNGQPVESAQVAFLTPGAARPAIAATDTQGKFTLRTFSEEDGAMAGEHRVTIVKQVPQGADADNPYPTYKNVLPAKYARPDTSGIVAEVSDEGENVFRFELVD